MTVRSHVWQEQRWAADLSKRIVGTCGVGTTFYNLYNLCRRSAWGVARSATRREITRWTLADSIVVASDDLNHRTRPRANPIDREKNDDKGHGLSGRERWPVVQAIGPRNPRPDPEADGENARGHGQGNHQGARENHRDAMGSLAEGAAGPEAGGGEPGDSNGTTATGHPRHSSAIRVGARADAADQRAQTNAAAPPVRRRTQPSALRRDERHSRPTGRDRSTAHDQPSPDGREPIVCRRSARSSGEPIEQHTKAIGYADNAARGRAETLFCTIDISRVNEDDKERAQVGAIRRAVEDEMRKKEDRQGWESVAMVRNADRVKVICRDEKEVSLVKEAAEKTAVRGARVLRDQLYPVKVDRANRTAVLDAEGSILPGAMEVLGEENEVTIAKMHWLSDKANGKMYGSMVIYVTKANDARRPLEERYFSMSGDRHRCSATSAGTRATRHPRARRSRCAAGARSKGTSTGHAR
jgi:hypothetical protein